MAFHGDIFSIWQPVQTVRWRAVTHIKGALELLTSRPARERRKCDGLAQAEIDRRHRQRLECEGGAQGQDIQKVLGEGEPRKLKRELLLMDRRAHFAVAQFKTRAFAALERGFEVPRELVKT